MTRAHAPNGLLVDPIYAKMRCKPLCLTTVAPPAFVVGNNGDVDPIGLTPGGHLLTGTGTPAGPSQLGSDQTLETFISVGTTEGGTLSSITESGRAIVYVDLGQDWTFNWGAALLQGQGPITDKYDIAVTIASDSGQTTLRLVEAPGTPQAYNWVSDEDPTYIITDSATNAPDNTVTQNSSRISLLQAAGLLPGTSVHGMFGITMNRVRKSDGQVQTHALTVEVTGLPQPGPDDSRAGFPTINGYDGNRVVTVAGEPSPILLRLHAPVVGVTLGPYITADRGRGWQVNNPVGETIPNPDDLPAYVIEIKSDGTIGIEFGHSVQGADPSIEISATPFEVQDSAVEVSPGRWSIPRTPASNRPFRLPAGVHTIRVYSATPGDIIRGAGGLGIRLWNLTE